MAVTRLTSILRAKVQKDIEVSLRRHIFVQGMSITVHECLKKEMHEYKVLRYQRMLTSTPPSLEKDETLLLVKCEASKHGSDIRRNLLNLGTMPHMSIYACILTTLGIYTMAAEKSNECMDMLLRMHF